MKIQQSELTLSSEHHLQQQTNLQLQFTPAAMTFSQHLNQQISPLPPPANPIAPESEALTREKEKAKRFESLWEMLFGSGQSQNNAPPPSCAAVPRAATAAIAAEAAVASPPALAILAFEQVRESELCSFSANGKVCLADGSTRQFAVNYQVARQTETTRALGAEWAALQDPLVLDFGAPTAQLSDHSVEFDLDGDGKKERMPMPASSSAWLFLDRNHNGQADDGSELFGPRTGQGFSELAELDDDHNGWIDENDSSFKDLKLWRSFGKAQDQGAEVQSLAQAGIGALALAYVKTEFSIVQQGDVLGQIRASSIWLGEQSGAGVLRQLDVATQPI